MTQMIQDGSITFQDLKTDIDNYLKSLSNWQEIKDNLTSSNLSIITDLIAGFGTYMLMNNHQLRNESYLQSASLPSSVYAISAAFGYQIARFTAPRIRIRYNNTPTIVLNTGDILGRYDKYDLVYFGKTLSFEQGDYIDLYVGKFHSKTTSVNYQDYIYEEDISPQELKSVDNTCIQLLVDGKVYTLSKDIEDYVVKKVAVDFSKSPYATTLMISDSYYGYGYSTLTANQTITIQWLETDGTLQILADEVKIDGKDSEGNDLSIYTNTIIKPDIEDSSNTDILGNSNNTGPVVGTTIVGTNTKVVTTDNPIQGGDFSFTEVEHDGANGDDLDHIRQLAPLYYSTQRRMVTDVDHKYILEAHPYIRSAFAIRDAGINQRSKLIISESIQKGDLISFQCNKTKYEWEVQGETLGDILLEVVMKIRYDPIVTVEGYSVNEMSITTRDPRYLDEWVFNTDNIRREVVQIGVEPKCCTVNLYYVKYDTVDEPIELTYYEQRDVAEYLNKYKMISTRLVLIPAERQAAFIYLDITLSNSKYRDEINYQINELIDSYELTLSTEFLYSEFLAQVTQIQVGDPRTGEPIHPVIAARPAENTWPKIYAQLFPDEPDRPQIQDIRLLDIVRNDMAYIKFNDRVINYR